MDIENLNYDDRGLKQEIMQDSISHNVLMLGYMNRDSLQNTIKTKDGEAHNVEKGITKVLLDKYKPKVLCNIETFNEKKAQRRVA